MSRRYWAVGLALLVSFAAGRWLAPEKIKIEKQIIEVEKKSSNKDTEAERNKRKETIITEKINSDGSKETTTHIVEETSASKKAGESNNSESGRAENETKEIERGTAKVTISALAGTTFSTETPIVYGGSISKPIFGPITIGAWGLTNKTAGFSLGLTF